MSFLWGGSSEQPDVNAFTPRSRAWWNQYSFGLALSQEGIAELSRTSIEIGSLIPDPLNWGQAAKPFRGLVVGAVQSGKTSSMIGVSAVALDQGYRIIVVLAGGKDDLRRQTARRFNTQLIRQRDPIPERVGAYTIDPTVEDRPLGGLALHYAIDVHEWNVAQIRMREVLRRGEPCVLVIKKLPASLAQMRTLLKRAFDEFGIEKLPTLILDDECDDASVDQAGMPIPEAIANLWRLPTVPPIAYVGYTATAAANLLQQPTNALYPKDFVYLLRYPNQENSSLTYRESDPNAWYSGSSCFSEDFGTAAGPEENFLVNVSVEDEDFHDPFRENGSLTDALRAYLVSGAFRLALQPGSDFKDCNKLPKPHSMLVQTSSSMHEHERWLKGIVELFGGTTNGSVGSFSSERVLENLNAYEAGWKKWYDEFVQSRERLIAERPSHGAEGFASWALVKANISVVVQNVKIRAVNSDPVIGQSLDYTLKLLADGSKEPPEDIYVIAIGGAKLSRGITLEGLCISYFTRWNPTPTEDTVLQICRWFGYRGKHLAFCRLFTSPTIYQGLQDIDENDRDLRLQLFRLMEEGKTPKEAGLVLRCNPRALPTAKLGAGTVFETRFSPYQNVFRNVEIRSFSASNQTHAVELIERVLASGAESVFNETGRQRGYLARNWPANEVAAILDRLEFTGHNPRLEGNPSREFHRSPDEQRPKANLRNFSNDIYQVAAYLREWAASSILGEVVEPPIFNVGVAFGEEVGHCEPFTQPLLNREISPSAVLNGTWTGRSAVWRGDARFDDPPFELLFDDSSLRREGANGLLLLYVIHKDATGRQSKGVLRDFHTATFGISIPAGGPKFKRVVVTPSQQKTICPSISKT